MNNEYFRNLLTQRWFEIGAGLSTQYQATIDADPSRQISALGERRPRSSIALLQTRALLGSPTLRQWFGRGVTGTDLQLRWEPTFAVIAEEYASDEALFLQEFSDAWVKLMNNDRFGGPAGSLCSDGDSVHLAEEKAESVAPVKQALHTGVEDMNWDVSSLMAAIL